MSNFMELHSMDDTKSLPSAAATTARLTVGGGAARRRDTIPAWTEHNEFEFQSDATDELMLARLGKKQTLRRNFDFVSMFAFTSTILVTWEGFFSVIPAFVNGGSAGVVYNFLVIFFGTLCTFTTISELASIAPTAAGQYHWVYLLAPRSCRKAASFLTGWMTVLAWQIFIASSAFTTGTLLQALLVLRDPAHYTPQSWHGTLLIWGVVLLAVLFNTAGSILLPVLECGFLMVHVLGFIAVFIILCYIAPHGDADQVFLAFYNGGAWPVQGLSNMVGLAGTVFVFIGADAAVHMAEEMHNAAVNVPRAMLASIVGNGLIGLAVVLATMFGFAAIADPDLAAILSSPIGYPFIALFAAFTGNQGGATAMAAIVLVMYLSCTVGIVTVSSRMIWAFARDRGLPFSHLLGRVSAGSQVPVNAVVTTTVIALLLALVNMGSVVVLNNLFSLSTAGFYSTYLACATLLLWHRLRGNIREPSDVLDSSIDQTDAFNKSNSPDLGAVAGANAGANTVASPAAPRDVHSGQLTWGPWRVRGWAGTAINAFAVLYLVLILFFSAWPATYAPQASGMNYSIVVSVGVMLCSVLYYVVSARKKYVGPVVEVVL